MSVKSWNAILIVTLFAALMGGGYVLYQNHLSVLQEQERARLEQEEAARAKAEAEKIASLTQEFEDFLNGFLSAVRAEVKDYRSARKVVFDVVSPANLSAPEYIEENHNLGEMTIMSLRLQMDKIMGLFEQANADFLDLLAQWPEDRREVIAQKWNEIKDENAGLYVAYFSSEQKLLAAFQTLLSFYNEKRDVLKIDPAQNTIIFDDPADQEQHLELKQKVTDLAAAQRALLSR